MNNNHFQTLTNDAHDKTSKQNEDVYVVAYLDALGAKHIMKSDAIGFANKIDACYRDALQILTLSRNDLAQRGIVANRIELKIFSDNILFLMKKDLEDDSPFFLLNLNYFLQFIAVFQTLSLGHKIAFRGSIRYGKILNNNIRVLGEGLINVVEDEENVAFYPRIIVYNDVATDYFKLLELQMPHNIQSKVVIDQDFDELHFINFLAVADDIDEIKCIFSTVQDWKKKYKNQFKISQKYNWLESYIIRYCHMNALQLNRENITMPNINNLFYLMKEKNITKAKVSKDTGISTGNLSDWANGRCLPSAEKLNLLADYLDCSIDYLLGRTDVVEVSRKVIPTSSELAAYDGENEGTLPHPTGEEF